MLQLRTIVRLHRTRLPAAVAGALLFAFALGLFMLDVRAEPATGETDHDVSRVETLGWRKSSPEHKGDSTEPAPPSSVTEAFENDLAPLSKAQVMRMLAIAELGGELDSQVFAKIGDSMTVSRSYLRCFARSTARERESWRAFEGLEEAVQHFGEGRAAGQSPFLRVSEAARVGWSVRSAIIGRPSPLRKELRATRPRFATVMFGTNDIESRSPRRFARRMWRLLEELESRGVVPIVSDILPQRRRGDQNHWVHRYNLIVRGLTEGRDLPLVRLHEGFRRLPRMGLAGDGIHANAFRPGRQTQACDMSPGGLRFGHNFRNLRTLQHLGRAAKVLNGEPVPMVSSPLPSPDSVPQALLSLPHASIESWNGTDEPRVYSVDLDDSAELRVMAIAKSEGPLQVQVEGPNGYNRTRRTDWVALLAPGRYRISVPRASRNATEFLLTVEVSQPAS